MELGRTTFRSYPLPYTQYHEERAEDLERERRLAEEQSAFISKTEDFIRKNIAGSNTKQAQSRRRMLDKLERLERPEDVWARAERMRFRFAETPRSGDIVLDVKGAAGVRGDVELFSGFDLLLRRGDRLGIVGPTAAANPRSSSCWPAAAKRATAGTSSAGPICTKVTSISTSARSTRRRQASTKCAAYAAISMPMGHVSTWRASASMATTRCAACRACRAERARAWRWQSCFWNHVTCCFSTSRPITWTSLQPKFWRRPWSASKARWC